uniref:Uncharacterized protein n=1 Tax=Oryza rufipogon TaxID=4529 RepID=A0A0E0QAL4_ORYRU
MGRCGFLVLPRDEATFRFVNEANKTKSGPSIHIQTGGLRRGSGAVTSSTTNNDGNIYNVVIFLETYIGDSVLSFAL